MTDRVKEVENDLLQLGRHFSTLTGRSRRRARVLDQSAYTVLSFMRLSGAVTYPNLEAALGLTQSSDESGGPCRLWGTQAVGQGLDTRP